MVPCLAFFTQAILFAVYGGFPRSQARLTSPFPTTYLSRLKRRDVSLVELPWSSCEIGFIQLSETGKGSLSLIYPSLSPLRRPLTPSTIELLCLIAARPPPSQKLSMRFLFGGVGLRGALYMGRMRPGSYHRL